MALTIGLSFRSTRARGGITALSCRSFNLASCFTFSFAFTLVSMDLFDVSGGRPVNQPDTPTHILTHKPTRGQQTHTHTHTHTYTGDKHNTLRSRMIQTPFKSRLQIKPHLALHRGAYSELLRTISELLGTTSELCRTPRNSSELLRTNWELRPAEREPEESTLRGPGHNITPALVAGWAVN